MESGIFSGGTYPGSPTTQNEIKTLLCYLLAEIEAPLNFQQIHEALRDHNLVNYFELIDNLNFLVKSDLISKESNNGIDFYYITDLGRKTANTLDNSLAVSIRQKALDSLKLVIARQKRLSEVITEIKAIENGGFKLKLAIPDEGENLISFNVFVPTKDEAYKLRDSFLNDPIFIYKSVMSLLSGDRKVLGDLKPKQDELF